MIYSLQDNYIQPTDKPYINHKTTIYYQGDEHCAIRKEWARKLTRNMTERREERL